MYVTGARQWVGTYVETHDIINVVFLLTVLLKALTEYMKKMNIWHVWGTWIHNYMIITAF